MQFSRYDAKLNVRILAENLFSQEDSDVQFYNVPARERKSEAFELHRTRRFDCFISHQKPRCTRTS